MLVISDAVTCSKGRYGCLIFLVKFGDLGSQFLNALAQLTTSIIKKGVAMFKKLFGLGILISINAALANSAGAITLIDLEGDKDCFGSNKELCNTLYFGEINGTGESGLNFDTWNLNQLVWDHDFVLPEDTIITGAKLTLSTFDVEDNGAGNGLGGEPYDPKLFIDGIEFANAFDQVFTPDEGAQKPINTIVFDFDQLLLNELLDGEINIVVNPLGGSRKDAIAIDYAELEITFTQNEESSSVPEPPNFLGLLAIGAIGAFGIKRCWNPRDRSSR